MSRAAGAVRRAALLCAGLLLCLAAWTATQAQHPVAHTLPTTDQKAAHRPGNAAKGTPKAIAISAAVGPDKRLWVVGLDEQRRLFLRWRASDSERWSPDVYPDIGGDQPAADGESRPKIAFGLRGQVAIAYTQPLAKPYTGAIRLLRSIDGGKRFLPPITVHQDRQIITHRFESIVFDERGNLHVYWVDKRDVLATRQPGASIYRAVSRDGGATFGPDTRVAGSSCECCRIALLADGGEQVVAMWRHIFPGSERDHAFVRAAADQASIGPAVRATRDGWQLEACPHHGPGLAAAARGGYHAVWFGERAGEAAVRYGRLKRSGEPDSDPIALPDEQAEHADVISHGMRVAVVWRSFDGRQTRLRAWVSNDDGASFRIRDLASATGHTDHPRLVRQDEKILAIWRTAEEVKVEQIPF